MSEQEYNVVVLLSFCGARRFSLTGFSLVGYEIRNTLVTDLSPDNKVKASMNEINASRRLKEAAAHKAEAEKTKQVKAAEAEAEAR